MKIIPIILALVLFTSIAHAEPVYLKASWYSVQSLKDEGTYKYSKGRCADGSYFNDMGFTCATRLFALGTLLRVSYGDRSVVVRVTDRIGKRFATKRIDLSKLAFSKLAELKRGIISVSVEEIRPGRSR